MKLIFILLAFFNLYGCVDPPVQDRQQKAFSGLAAKELKVGFLIIDGVYNSELMAPYDVFHHTVFHAEPAMRVFTVGRTKDPVLTFEGIRIIPDYALSESPAMDVLVVPSAKHNMDTDLEDEDLISFVKEKGSGAAFVMSLCDGAFLLAKAGLLANRHSTTFPSDIDPFRKMFPDLEVHEEVSFVHDGPVITSAGGAKSYDAALYLVELLYGKKVADGVGEGICIDWDLQQIAHFVAD